MAVKGKVWRKPCSKKAKNKKTRNKEEPEKPSEETKGKKASTLDTNLSGSIIVDKVFEPLQVALDAYNSSLRRAPKEAAGIS